MAKRRTPGMISRNRSSRLAARGVDCNDKPVTLAPGRAKLSTRPAPIGSLATAKIIGMVDVACFAAAADLWRSSLCACESQYPAEIHDQIQSENVGIKSLGILDTFRRNVRHDAFYRHAASHTSIRVRHAPKHCVRRSSHR